jgi:hypothetical protein
MTHQSNASRLAEGQRDPITNTDERIDEINKQAEESKR